MNINDINTGGYKADKINFYMTWVVILIGYLNIYDNKKYSIIFLTSTSIINIFKYLFTRLQNSKNNLNQDLEQKSISKTRMILHVMDAAVITLFSYFCDNNGEFIFILIIFTMISMLLIYEENKWYLIKINLIFDAYYTIGLLLHFNFTNNLNIKTFFTKIVILIVIQISYLYINIEAYKKVKEKNNLVEKEKFAYKEIELTHKALEQRTNELEKSKLELENKNIKLSKNVAELFTMQEISKFITSTLNIDELLNLINDMILGIMGVNYSTILMIKFNNELDVVVSNIKDKNENNKILSIFEDLINDVCRNREPILNISTNKKIYKDYNIGSVLCIPLIAKGQLIGISVAAHENEDALNNDSLAYLSSIFNQVSIAVENAQLYREMKEIAEIDGLTRVYNRAYFQTKYAELKNKQGIKNLAVTILDIDFFKKFNDTYGHQFGDLVLKEVASISKRYLVDGEFVSRYGGEEFVIIFENKTESYVMEKIERIRETIEETKVSDAKFNASVTASFGVAFYPTTYNSIDEHLLTCADDALYESKKNGRNRVTLSKDE